MQVGRTPKPEAPTKREVKVRNGRSSRRQGMHQMRNKPWFGPVTSSWAPCPNCFMIRTACECDND